MRITGRAMWLCLLATAVTSAFTPICPAAEPLAPGSTASPAANPQRSQQDIQQDLQKAQQDLQNAMTSPRDLFDPAKRAAAAPKAIPPVRKMVALIEELGTTMPADQRGPVIAGKGQYLALLLLLGDKEAGDTVKTMSASKDPTEAAAGKSSRVMADWWSAAKDGQAQGKVLDSAQGLAKEYPSSDVVTNTLVTLVQSDQSTPESAERVEAMLGEMKGPLAERAKPALEQFKQQRLATQKLKGMEGKPLTIEGAKVDGGKFTSADWKGKVVLVDFWATWCGPCMAELPRVKKIYAENHPKGLEIIGVSCDNTAQDLTNFRQQNADAPWPQLFDANKPGWHALATDYGVGSIPTMFLIDKKGVLRTVEARDNMEEMIPKLLAETGEAPLNGK